MMIFPVLGWMLLPGCCAAIVSLTLSNPNTVTGLETVTGPEGGSVSVMCHYEKGYEEYPKFWCRDNVVSCLGSHIIETAGSEVEVWQDRFSIRDNHTQRTITVTMETLTMADTGTYLCGIKKLFGFDPTHAVELSVSPAGWTRTTPRYSLPSSSAEPASARTAAEKKQDDFPSQHTTPKGSPEMAINILIPCTLLVLILLLVAIAVLIFIFRRKRKGSSVQTARKTSHSDLDSEKKEEIAYATVTISTPNQHAIYSNIEQLSKAMGSASLPKETLYTTVKSRT
ncbi:PREDICTED: CMRF35-like molecule 5 [Gavialis gangeticus]|uniref:CMRF35-like molecule 5 n=1 Tax=Gavialis gangeticus TaxID=94835 RepID=UPI00092F4078|nr:PREDICTED: CMRF35-like molecule 5 [Gavialis gangeticus]